MNYRFPTESRDELDAAAEHYDRQRRGLGFEFLQAVESTIQTLLPDPSSWPVVARKFRRCRVWRFPYDVIFRFHDETAVIFAVAHHHRRPSYWRRRSDKTKEP